MTSSRQRVRLQIDRNLAHLELDGEEPLADHERPRTRADCANVPRPCPFVGCRHNNYLEVLAAGTIKPNGSLDPWDVPPENSCSLDVAEREGGLDIRGTAKALGCSSTRVDQVMRGVEIKLRGASETARGLREYK